MPTRGKYNPQTSRPHTYQKILDRHIQSRYPEKPQGVYLESRSSSSDSDSELEELHTRQKRMNEAAVRLNRRKAHHDHGHGRPKAMSASPMTVTEQAPRDIDGNELHVARPKE